MVIVCDDTKTAVAYFDELKREVKQKAIVQVVSASRHGTSPESVVNRAIELVMDLKDHGSDNSSDPDDSVWALIDLELTESDHRKAIDAKIEGSREGVNVLLSKPCFEVWTLAHFLDTGQTFAGCSAVLQQVKAEWRRTFGIELGPKAQADYAKLKQYRHLAIKRAKAHCDNNDQSWTEVWQVVEAVLRFVQNPDR